jgi:prepilin-type N-terminal cleavage/methylation domain-containing protein
MARLRRSSGFSLVEVVVVTALFASLVGTLVTVHKTTLDFTRRTYAEMRANEEQQRNLAAIANVLRGAAVSSLTGFNVAGIATAPSFQTVTGADAAGRILGPVQSLAWTACTSTEACGCGGGSTASNMGDLELAVGLAKVTLASGVAKGGFVVTKSANTLKVTITTRYSTDDQTTATVTGDVSVSLRN